ncbi:MAG: F0F1 ATP synthase subunit delta [Bacteroidales bacterium]|nr:F0F1 ATP synthase subunit delta [Bacteroidales bacterium]
MNTGIVVTRYARALVLYVRETGQGDLVCAQAEKLFLALSEVGDLDRMMRAQDVVPGEEKIRLLETAAGAPLAAPLERFLRLLLDKGRMGLVREILHDFVDQYRRSIGIRKAHLTVVSEPSETLLERLRALVRAQTGDEVVIDVDIDPSLVGGFVFDVDDYLLDASVSHQLELIRSQFIERNRRII